VVKVLIGIPKGAWKGGVLRRAGLDRSLRLHDLRHTIASRLVMRGVPLLVVSLMLGRRSIMMTMRYFHLLPETRAEAIQNFESHEDCAEVA